MVQAERRPFAPVLLCLVVLAGLLPLLNTQPAHAAAAAGYSVMGADPTTGEQGTTANATTTGTRYDFYANPTDTTTPIAGVRAFVPSGTTGLDPITSASAIATSITTTRVRPTPLSP